jgi:excisionase family DNA binding protein
VSPEREIMTPEEAADFLRLSVSTVYQRKDIPRHRLPGSRQIRFIRSELLAWMKGELMGGSTNAVGLAVGSSHKLGMASVDIPAQSVYHRNARYR